MALPGWAWTILAVTSDKNKGKSLFIIFLGYYDFVFGSANARRLRGDEKTGDSRKKAAAAQLFCLKMQAR